MLTAVLNISVTSSSSVDHAGSARSLTFVVYTRSSHYMNPMRGPLTTWVPVKGSCCVDQRKFYLDYTLRISLMHKRTYVGK